ncbi:MAG: hypothetical protein ACP5H8_00605 [Candidatus Micrarchaeia archaeon]
MLEATKPVKKEEEKVKRLISEEKKISGLGELLQQISGFVQDVHGKKSVQERIEKRFVEHTEKLSKIYSSTIDPNVRKAVREALDEIKKSYVLAIAELDIISSENLSAGEKVQFYKDIEESAMYQFSRMMENVKRIIENATH